MKTSDAAGASLASSQFVLPAFAPSLDEAREIVLRLTLERSLGSGSIGRC
jgi:hypothetical protein